MSSMQDTAEKQHRGYVDATRGDDGNISLQVDASNPCKNIVQSFTNVL
jgi:hypothetical protein